MTADLPIEPATPADLPHLRAIQRDVLAEPAPDLLAAILEGAGLALRAGRDRPVGYVLALTAGSVAYVPELAVAADRHREGIGTALLGTACDRAREDGCREIRLTVRREDDRARAFYLDRGFDVRDRVSDHYETGSGTGLLLARPL